MEIHFATAMLWKRARPTIAVMILLLVRPAVAGRELRSAGSVLRNIGGEITGLIQNTLRGDRGDIRNEILVSMAQRDAIELVEKLRAEIEAIISTLVLGDENQADNLIEILLGSSQLVSSLESKVAAYIVNELDGNANEVKNTQWYDLIGSNSDFLSDVYLDISGIMQNVIAGSNNEAKSKMNVEVGSNGFSTASGGTAQSDPEVPEAGEAADPDTDSISIIGPEDLNLDVLLEAVVLNEVTNGNGNYLDNLVNIAAFNGVNAENIKAEIVAMVVNRVGGNDNSVENLVNIALGICSDGPCDISDFAVDVSATIFNDIQGDESVISNTMRIVGAIGSDIDGKNAAEVAKANSALENLERAIVETEAIIYNVVRPSGLIDQIPSVRNKIKNNIDIEFLRDVAVSDIKAKISAIIANEVKGNANAIENMIRVRLGNNGL